MSDVPGTIATFTIDRIAYSPSPPIVFAVVDFDHGGRLPIELTDVEADDLTIGDRVEMTFRSSPPTASTTTFSWPGRSAGNRAEGQKGSFHGSHGIKDQVAIVGWAAPDSASMGQSADDLLVDASEEAFASAR